MESRSFIFQMTSQPSGCGNSSRGFTFGHVDMLEEMIPAGSHGAALRTIPALVPVPGNSLIKSDCRLHKTHCKIIELAFIAPGKVYYATSRLIEVLDCQLQTSREFPFFGFDSYRNRSHGLTEPRSALKTLSYPPPGAFVVAEVRGKR